MSNRTPSGHTSHSPALTSPAQELETGPAKANNGRLVLPNPLPDDENPFRVIGWILFTAHVAALHLTKARQARVEQLGRKIGTEDTNGVPMLHWEDDVDRRGVESELYRLTGNAWSKSLRDARQLSVTHGIPFGVVDSILKAACDKLDETQCVIQGVASDKEVHLDSDISRRLYELADSTTPAIQSGRPNLTPPTGGPPGEVLPGEEGMSSAPPNPSPEQPPRWVERLFSQKQLLLLEALWGKEEGVAEEDLFSVLGYTGSRSPSGSLDRRVSETNKNLTERRQDIGADWTIRERTRKGKKRYYLERQK